MRVTMRPIFFLGLLAMVLGCTACVSLDEKPIQRSDSSQSAAGKASKPTTPGSSHDGEAAVGGRQKKAQEAPVNAVDDAKIKAWKQAAPSITKLLSCAKFVAPGHSSLRKIAPRFQGDGDWTWNAKPMAPIKIFGLPVAEFSYEYAF
ncbi:MAG: hypothetical protein L6Q40_10085, partial [Azonexus sp.]|nr:hypothetical protein [Azonexus sp.]